MSRITATTLDFLYDRDRDNLVRRRLFQDVVEFEGKLLLLKSFQLSPKQSSFLLPLGLELLLELKALLLLLGRAKG